MPDNACNQICSRCNHFARNTPGSGYCAVHLTSVDEDRCACKMFNLTEKPKAGARDLKAYIKAFTERTGRPPCARMQIAYLTGKYPSF